MYTFGKLKLLAAKRLPNWVELRSALCTVHYQRMRSSRVHVCLQSGGGGGGGGAAAAAAAAGGGNNGGMMGARNTSAFSSHF